MTLWRRDLSRWNHPIHEYRGISTLPQAGIPAGLLAIEEADTSIDVLYEPRGALTTVVFFHAAITAPNVKLPYITGQTLHGGAHVNRIWIADPSLYRDPALGLAWYTGTDALPLDERIPDLIGRLHRAAGGNRLVLFGPSGGGYAALRHGHAIPGSLAIAVNPQTSIARYSRSHVVKYARIAFGASSDAEVDEVIDRIDGDLCRRYEVDGNFVIYVQNRGDWHREAHMRPFLERVARRDRVWTLEGEWGKGHVVVPPDVLRELVTAVVSTSGPWERALVKLESRPRLWRRQWADPSGLDLRAAKHWTESSR